MNSENKLQIFVITLENATQRQQSIAARLKELGLSFAFIYGVDGRKLDMNSHPLYAPLKRRLFYGRDLSNGELGCVLAHKKIYQTMIDNSVRQALVLEDDAILTDELPCVLEGLHEGPQNWDLIRFLGREKNYRSTRPITSIKGTSATFSRQLTIPGGAYGYMLNLKAAKRLNGLMRKNWLAIDTLHGMSWHTGLKTFSVMPSPVLPNDQSPSCIDTQDNNLRWDKSIRLPLLLRICYPITRGAWKFYLGICTRFVQIKTYLPDARLRAQK